MDFKESLLKIADRIAKTMDSARTEEAVKTSFILPFIQTLGYDVFNPEEVIPEGICDYGTKKGEKVDYTICINKEPVMIIECKHYSADLDKFTAQLFRYYQVSNAKFGVLTNGIIYKFFTDLDKQNNMDKAPFFEINMLDLRESHIEKLKEFSKERYDMGTILNSATEMKYVNAFRSQIVSLSQNPSDDFVRLLGRGIYTGKMTQSTIEMLRPMIARAFQQYTNDFVNERLKSAITPDVPSVSEVVQPEVENDSPIGKVITTDEEIQAYYIICAILCPIVDLDRVYMRDAQSYCAILCDDNNRKPICRLHFNGGKKFVETFDEMKVGTKHNIVTMNDIYKLSSELVKVVKHYIE